MSKKALADLPNVNLNKWPAMIVHGEKVTTEQAAEILIRTDSHIPKPSSNTHDYDKQVCRLFGVPYNGCGGEKDPWPPYDKAPDGFYRENWKALERLEKRMKTIPLGYLNNSRIVSSWIGGPHGWCNWSGDIFSNNYNIGKWPDVEPVYEEWSAIAKAFPYLELKCQLLSGETCEPGLRPLVEYSVSKGKVSVRGCEEGEMSMAPAVECDITGLVFRNPDREIGTHIKALEEALKKVYGGKIPQYRNPTYTKWLKANGHK